MLKNKFLVLLDGGAHCEEAIHRARLLADFTESELELLWFGKKPAWEGFEEVIADLEQNYKNLSLNVSRDVLSDIKSLWERDKFTFLIKGCDLRHNGLLPLASMDWRLLRETPCPMLLVKSSESWMKKTILAAINPGSDKKHQLDHDKEVLRLASLIASKTQSPLHTAIATEPPMMGGDPESQVPDLINEKAKKAAESIYDDLGLHPDETHLGEGPAEFYIPKVSREQEPGLVIISTRARGGLSAALLGNTAERMLDRLTCDVLVMRPGLSS